MTQDKRGNDSRRCKESDSSTTKRNEPAAHNSASNVDIPSKVVIRRLPPSLNAETFLKQISPIPNYDYFRFAEAELALGQYAFSSAYINFVNPRDVWIFQEKFDGYVFLDEKGNEYPAIVEFAPYPRISKKKNKKPDPRINTIEQDVDYLKFLETLKKVEVEAIPPPEMLLEEIEAKEKLLKANHGCLKMTTPLIEFLAKKKEEKRNAFMHARDEKRRKELERRKQREELHRRALEKEKEFRELTRRKQKEREEREKKKEEVVQAPIKLLKKDKDEKESQKLATEGEPKDEQEDSLPRGADKVRQSSNEESRVKEQNKKASYADGNDRRFDDRKDKNRRPEKTFGERRKEEDRRRTSDSYSQKESNYSARKKSESYGDQSDKNRYKEKDREADTQPAMEKDVDQEREKGQDRDNGQYPGSYHGYRRQERDGKQRDRDYYRDGRKDDGRDYYRDGRRDDGRREAKGDYKYDHGRPKEPSKGSAKESRYPRSEPGHSDQTGGGRRFHQEPRGSAGSRNKPTNYDSRKESGEKSRSYDSRKDGGARERYLDKPSQSGKNTDKASDWPDQGKKESTPPQLEENLVRRGSCDSTGSSTSDASKATRAKPSSEGDTVEATAASFKKKDDSDWNSKSHVHKDSSGGGNRGKIRYKDRPEKEIYNPAKRAVERQKEATTSSR